MTSLHYLILIVIILSTLHRECVDGAKKKKTRPPMLRPNKPDLTDVKFEFKEPFEELDGDKHRNITDLLDTLLLGYDNHLRPNFGGPPIEVLIDLHVRSMGPISEIDMSYSMDCYFRQTWQDSRLAYDSSIYRGNPLTLALSISMLDRIWKPDTYFYNGKNALMHTITVPNKFVRIETDGRVLYSSRMTVKASCPMHLESFPMDTQRCPLELGSFGYSMRDVIYKWNPKRSVEIAKDMKMSQFDLIASPSGNITGHFRKDGPYSRLIVSFHFERLMGSFLIEVYAPCIMLVVLSWVSFWINREATADRVALGIMTVLTMTFLGLETRNDLPKVSYMTALDYFVAITFAFIFATIVQFAVVHHFTKVGSGEFYFSPGWFEETASGRRYAGRRCMDSEESDEDGGRVICRVGPRARATRSARTNARCRTVSSSADSGLGSRSMPNQLTTCLPAITTLAMCPEVLNETLDEQDDDDEYYDYEDETDEMDPSVCPIHGNIFDAQNHSASLRNLVMPTLTSDSTTMIMSAPQSALLGDDFGHYAPQYLDPLDVFGGNLSTNVRNVLTHRSVPAVSALSSTIAFANPVESAIPVEEPTLSPRSDDEGQNTSGKSSRFSSLRASIRGGLRRTFSRGKKARDDELTFQLNSVSQIDRASRVFFPLAFIIINLIYWYTYLTMKVADEMA